MTCRNIVALLLMSVLTLISLSTSAADILRVGILTDLHAHDTDDLEDSKIMTLYPNRLEEIVASMNNWPADVTIELGDHVNGRFVKVPKNGFGDQSRILDILEHVESIYSQLSAPRYYVLGNHDVYDLTKEEFLSVADTSLTYQSFDMGGYHFVLLDAQFNNRGEDLGKMFWGVVGVIPKQELLWLRNDLAATALPTILCIHQRLDVESDFLAGGPQVSNREEVNDVIAQDGDVIAVFQGHDHHYDYSLIGSTHYITFPASVASTIDSPAVWTKVSLNSDDKTITLDVVGLQLDKEFTY